MGLKSRTLRFTTEMRRARLLARHHLAAPATSIEQVAGDLCGLHSSDPATVFLAARARRSDDFTAAELERALYDRRTLVRLLGMRSTMFVVPLDLAPVINAACTRALLGRHRRRLIAMLEDQGIAGDGDAWLAAVERKTLEALAGGAAVARDLVTAVPELGEKLSFGEGKKWAATVGVSTRVLFLLATAAAIVRGRPRGRWISSQYEWARIESWLGSPLADIETKRAAAELARRYLERFGPVTEKDVQWWTGWSKRQTREALGAAGAREVELDGGAPALVLEGDLEVPAPGPTVALLPALDPTIMGYKQRGWFLDAGHLAELFDRNGNVGPTIWVDGRVVGGWSQRNDTGEIAVELLEPVSASARGRIDDEAEALSRWLGDVRVIPRFQTPLDKRLRS